LEKAPASEADEADKVLKEADQKGDEAEKKENNKKRR